MKGWENNAAAVTIHYRICPFFQVLYVDFGTKMDVSAPDLHYLHKDFCRIPAQESDNAAFA